jgi:site-specific DNA recombinase
MAAIMARVSLVKQAKEGYSLPAQIDLGREIATKYGLATSEQYVLQDAGYSGDDWDRPAINRALALIRSGKIKALIFTMSDRFSRDVEGGLRVIREIRQAGGRIIFGDVGEYADDDNFRLMLTIKMAIAENEKIKIKVRTRSGVLRKVRDGHAFGRMPYGFKTENGKIVPVAEQIPVLKQIFEWAAAGWSQRKIMRELVGRNIPAPWPGKRGNWNGCSIAKMLRDPFYATGEWYYNKRRGAAPDPEKIRKPDKERHAKNTSHKMRPREEWIQLGGDTRVKPVIERGLFERVAAAMARNIHTLGGRPSDRYLLKSLIWCGKCEKPWCGHTNNKGRYARYGCANRDRFTGKHHCDAGSVLCKLLDQCVWDAIMETLGNEQTLRAAVEEHMAEQENSTNGKDVARLQARIEELRRQEFKARGEELRSGEVETAELYRGLYKEAMQERRGLEAELLTLVSKGATGKIDTARIARFIKAARRVDLANKETRSDVQELFRECVERVDYLAGAVTISLRVPLDEAEKAGKNCKNQQPVSSSFILLKLNRRVA